ncbi:hypothetical protein AX13_15095 [Comamonas aquatica DA1877]|uniref:Uncharacterized protein n=1 Tax=Comamonas aquatica DA1877 TaxID=1457173 RepID=A0A014MR13_9BURK|nr:hypothetical protein AX13_15095 [Comamonas aquatica DA1877]
MFNIGYHWTCQSNHDETLLQIGFMLDRMIQKPGSIHNPHLTVADGTNDLSCRVVD